MTNTQHELAIQYVKEGFLYSLKHLMIDYASVRDNYGNNLLHIAVQEQYKVRIIEFLLEKGVERTASNNDNYTPIHLAYPRYYDVLFDFEPPELSGDILIPNE